MSIEDIILYCFKSNEPMRYSTLYHLLKGKKTTSVLSFARLYQLLDFFSLFPKLDKSLFEKNITNLINSHDLVRLDSEFVQLTEQGRQKIEFKQIETFYLREYTFYKIDDIFWLRLLFISQVISYKSHSCKTYLPIDNDLIRQYRVKDWLAKEDFSKLVKVFFNEWVEVLNELTRPEQVVIVSQLVGYDVAGLTLEQISKENDQTLLTVYLTHKSALHKLLENVINDKDKYPKMHSIVELIKSEIDKDSVELTKYLYKKGHTISEIAKMRRLKESTITDHFIEMNINKSTEELLGFIDDQTFIKLKKYLVEYPNYKIWKFSNVREEIPSLMFYEFKFFQFILLDNKGEYLCLN